MFNLPTLLYAQWTGEDDHWLVKLAQTDPIIHSHCGLFVTDDSIPGWPQS